MAIVINRRITPDRVAAMVLIFLTLSKIFSILVPVINDVLPDFRHAPRDISQNYPVTPKIRAF